jgi:RimJ/RimL family protein N-acetyltransferase
MFIIQSPYDQCPVIDGENLQLRLVTFEDVADLLNCYSDPKAQPIFNSDNCTSNFAYSTAEEMKNAIQFWLADYERKIYVRFSIVERKTGHVIGTIEFFTKKATDEKTEIGLLRIDLQSRFETMEVLDELIQMAEANFPKYFAYEAIVTKAINATENRIQALQKNGFERLPNRTLVSYDDYYVKRYLAR